MRTQLIRPRIGRLAGTVQTVPAAVAERLLAQGQADALSADDIRAHEADLAILSGEDAPLHRDPRRRRRA